MTSFGKFPPAITCSLSASPEANSDLRVGQPKILQTQGENLDKMCPCCMCLLALFLVCGTMDEGGGGSAEWGPLEGDMNGVSIL